MRFNSSGRKVVSRCAKAAFVAAFFGFSLNGCVALDEYINPYYNDELDEQSASSDTSINDSVDSGGGDNATRSSGRLSENSDQQEADVAAVAQVERPGEEVTAQALLANMGPNPFLAYSTKPSASAQAQYHRALDAMKAEDWPMAERLLNELVLSNRQLSGPLLNLGIAQAKQEKDEQAQTSFENAIKVNASNQEAYNQLGLLQRKRGQFTDAKNTYLKAISVWPGYAPIRLNLGILYELYIGDLAQALNQYQTYQALQTEPDRKVKGWIVDLQRRLQVTRS